MESQAFTLHGANKHQPHVDPEVLQDLSFLYNQILNVNVKRLQVRDTILGPRSIDPLLFKFICVHMEIDVDGDEPECRLNLKMLRAAPEGSTVSSLLSPSGSGQSPECLLL
ncbi:unnamed protein product [Pleuronectes platessa]|uniref:Uncharacterized protein n=1 Tax=Pleuronectes platessa TaxID=8262 RepID=A0A9N7Y271_PLEPL|nr:unnamed protein product [Pleuronectes platessa]